MVDRLAPFLILLLNQFLTGFAFLFGLILSGHTPLPKVGPWLAALTVWTVPRLVRLARSASSQARAPKIYRAVMRSIRHGYLTILVTVAAGALLRQVYRDLSWAVVGLAAFAISGWLEGRQLGRQLDSLAVLD